MNNRLAELNSAQKDAVLTTEGPVMILAGAGSGKTRTIVSRIIHLLEELQVAPYQILALTFSNKAAREMKDRVARELFLDMGVLQITTFHSFCARLLRSEYNYLGLGKNFTIYDDGESKSIVKALLAKRGISTKEQPPYDILSYIDDLKNNGYYEGAPNRDDFDVDRSDPFYEYYLEYEMELHRSNAVDFGGLITGVLQLFETHSPLLQRYQERFKYLLVDEYQDTNRAQFHLVRMLSALTRNICVVGDEDQSIYSWRGADIRNILDYEEFFPESKLIKLEQNYRSSKLIIEAASQVISNNGMRKDKKMWTSNPDGDSISLIECRNDKDEVDYVASSIQKLLNDSISAIDIAVFYRNNAQSRMLEDALVYRNIKYRIIGGIKFYERKEIKDLLAYIRVVVNSKDSLALSRIINVPTRGIGATSIRKLENEAVSFELSLWEIIERIVASPQEFTHLRLSGKIKNGLQELVDLISEVRVWEKPEESVMPSQAYEKLLNESGYLGALKKDKNYESLARIENLQELLSGIKQYEQLIVASGETPSLAGFLETITLDTSQASDSSDEQQEVTSEISLMTIHGSKGLEYPYVFVIGAEESVFPSYRSMEDGEQAIEEERRLFYVAMTRAMTRLTISYAQARMLWGALKFNRPSRFVAEIPESHCRKQKFSKGQGSRVSSASKTTEDGIDYSDEYSQEMDYAETMMGSEDQDSIVAKPIADLPGQSYPVGCDLVHSIYGKGVVLDVEGHGADEKVLIKFSDGSKKRFMVKFAPLTRD